MSDKLQIQPGSDLDRKAKEIAKLYGGICAAARTALRDAIKIGGVLLDVHASPAFKGKWLAFLAQCVPFSQSTAWRYMEYYKHREELFKLNNLSEANGLILALPENKSLKKKRRPNKVVEELVSKGIAVDEKAALNLLAERSEQPDDDTRIGIADTNNEAAPPDEAPGVAPKRWQPDVLDKGDLTPDELVVEKHLRSYLSNSPSGRGKVFMRYLGSEFPDICESTGSDR